jgi:general secretion pathway protein J
MRRAHCHPPRRPSGFTLIELLVAVAVLALLAVMSWRGIDGMVRAQVQLRERADAIITLQGTLSQWTSDLDAAVGIAPTRAIDWDGRSLRLTRRSNDGVTPALLVVAWTVRAEEGGLRWHRWQSPPLATRGDWQQAWARAQQWGQDAGSNEGQGSDTVLLPVQDWQILYFRNDAWGPALSAEALAAGAPVTSAAGAPLPDGVRLVLVLPPGGALSGPLVRDWVRPTLTTAKTS